MWYRTASEEHELIINMEQIANVVYFTQTNIIKFFKAGSEGSIDITCSDSQTAKKLFEDLSRSLNASNVF